MSFDSNGRRAMERRWKGKTENELDGVSHGHDVPTCCLESCEAS